MLEASDIAYLCALLDKAPSSHPRRAEILEELQHIYRATQGRKYSTDVLYSPVLPDHVVNAVIAVRRG